MNKRFIVIVVVLLFLYNFQSLSAKRIISLSQSLTKELRDLGVENQMVGCTSYCQTTRKMPIVASAVKVNVEKVVALKPDLVVATSLTSNETLHALKKMKVNIVVFSTIHSYSEICAQFLQLGKLVGKETQARNVLKMNNLKISKMRSSYKLKSRRVFIQLGANPLFAVIPNTFMNDYITYAGSKNIAQGMTSGTITREAVLARNPEVIFVVSMGISSEEKNAWKRYTNLDAVKNDKIFIIDSNKACLPTPTTFAETLDVIIKCLK